MNTIKVSAPAKINIILRVLKRKRKEYHHIQSIFQTISLNDILYIKKIPFGIVVKCSDNTLSGKNNIVFKAAKIFFEASKIKGGVEIYLEKKIPIESGLGSGSSDAASTLITLNKIYGFPLSTKELHKLAVKVGSDVPFFLYKGTCLVEGIGDRIIPLPFFGKLWVVIVVLPLKIPTLWAYRMLDKEVFQLTRGRRCIKMFLQNSICTYNDFERIIKKNHPFVVSYKQKLERETGSIVGMSGKGPALFILESNKKKAEAIYKSANSKGGFVYLAQFI